MTVLVSTIEDIPIGGTILTGGCNVCNYSVWYTHHTEVDLAKCQEAMMNMLLLSAASTNCSHMETHINEMKEPFGGHDKDHWLLELRKRQRAHDDARRREKAEKPKKKRKKVWRKKVRKTKPIRVTE